MCNRSVMDKRLPAAHEPVGIPVFPKPLRHKPTSKQVRSSQTPRLQVASVRLPVLLICRFTSCHLVEKERKVQQCRVRGRECRHQLLSAPSRWDTDVPARNASPRNSPLPCDRLSLCRVSCLSSLPLPMLGVGSARSHRKSELKMCSIKKKES